MNNHNRCQHEEYHLLIFNLHGFIPPDMFPTEFQDFTSWSTSSAPHPHVVNMGMGKRLAPRRTPLSISENRELCLSQPSHWHLRSPRGTAGSSCLHLRCASVAISQDGVQVRIKVTDLSKTTTEQNVTRKVLMLVSGCKVQGTGDYNSNSPCNGLDVNKHRLSIRFTVKP